MITNERQYKITKSQLAKLDQAVLEFDLDSTANQVGSDILAKAELEALKSEVDNLSSQLQEYDNLKSGINLELNAESLAELPHILIKARIAQHLSQQDLANQLGLKEQQIQRYESEGYASASLRRLIEVAEALNITVTEIAEIRNISKANIHIKRSLDWSKFPIREMYRRGWFEGFTGSLEDAKSNAEFLIWNFVTKASKRPATVFHRQSIRSGSETDGLALFAWECRVLYLANQETPQSQYSAQLLDKAWFSNLSKVSYKENGPSLVKDLLIEVGIPLIIEPHLLNTYLDGAALLGDNFPVIGMTLRFDRVDNFWFVLFHELFHVAKHLQYRKLETVFNNLDIESQDAIEKEADMLAGEALIPIEVWETALPRYVRTKESISTFANKYQVNPAIIAGRIRKEADNYTILTDLVGQGSVRKQFPNINFGVG